MKPTKPEKPPDSKITPKSVKPKTQGQPRQPNQDSDQTSKYSQSEKNIPSTEVSEIDLSTQKTEKRKDPSSPKTDRKEPSKKKTNAHNSVDIFADLDLEVGEMISDISDQSDAEIQCSSLPDLNQINSNQCNVNNKSKLMDEACALSPTGSALGQTSKSHAPNVSTVSPENHGGTNQSSSQPPQIHRRATSAKLDLSKIVDYPQTTRQVYMTSTDPTRLLTSMNPFKLKTGIDQLCGPVVRVEYLRSGTLVLTAASYEQVSQLLAQTRFPTSDIPISVKVAWARHFTSSHMANYMHQNFLVSLTWSS
jgi:hypothetical protein